MGRPPPYKRLMTGFDPPGAHQQTAHLKASRSSAGQSTRFRGERSQDRSLPRRPIGALTGNGAGPVLKTVSTATCGDRDLSAPPIQGRLTGQVPAPAGNRAVRLKRMGIVRSVFRHYGRVNPAGAGRPFEAGWMGNHWGSRPRPSASSRATADGAERRRGDDPPPYPPPQAGEGREGVTRSGAPVARLAHDQEIGRSIRPSATILGRLGTGEPKAL